MAQKKLTSTLPDFPVAQWGGTNTAIKSAKDLDIGVSPSAVNWVTGWDPRKKIGDHIELRRGMAVLGNRILGSGQINGLGVASDLAGNQVPYFAYQGGTLMYYNAQTNANVQITTLPAAAASDYVSIEPFQGLGGNFAYVSSPNSSLYKSAVADPGSILDVTKSTMQGWINFAGGRMNLWNKNGNAPGSVNKTDVFQSGSDFSNYSQMGYYPQLLTQAETFGTGNGTQKTFNYTLQNQSGGSVNQVQVAGAISAGVSITGFTTGTQPLITTSAPHGITAGQFFIVDGMSGTFGTNFNKQILQAVAASGNLITVNLNTTGYSYAGGGDVYQAESFTDNQNGVMNSNLGGTGTINYITGAITVNFNTAPVNGGDILAAYFFQGLMTGVESFTVPADPGSSSPYVWPQRDGGGGVQTVQPFDGELYAFHNYRTWAIENDPNTYTNSNSIPYRNSIGTPYYKSAFPTGDGVIFIDTSIPAYPKFKILEVAPNTNIDTIEPEPLSDDLDLTQYGFSAPPVFFWNNYYLFACQNIVNGSTQSFNGSTFIMNTESGYWDRLDYQMSMFAQYYGMLLGGSSVSNNVFTLFSGFDDDGATINNFWTSGIYDLGWQGLKTTERFVIEGLMQPSQSLQIYVSYDEGPFTLVQTIKGTDPCVAQGNSQLVGSDTIGSQTVGSGAVYANPFQLDFGLNSDYYNYIQVQFVATGIGYIELDKYVLKCNHRKSMTLQPQNTL